VPATSFAELLAYAKKLPQPMRHGNAVPTNELTMQMIRAQSGLVAEAIPYKSTAQVMAAVLGSEVDLVVAVAQAYLSNVQAGKLRGLFVMAALRVPGVAEKMQSAFGAMAVGSSPEDLLRAQQNEVRFWTEAAKLANFSPQ
jgi:tripartite-type tricarboxylate transporter receptor subunit TctC